MDYSHYTREQLTERISELELFNVELMQQHEEVHPLHRAWPRGLAHYYWNISSGAIMFNPGASKVFGYLEEEVPERYTLEYFKARIHPDDRDRVEAAVQEHLDGKTDAYEVEYRVKGLAATDWLWHFDRGLVSQRDDEGEPQLITGLVFDITQRKQLERELASINERLAHRANTDGLTGIANHRTLMENLTRLLAEADEAPRPVAVSMFDIDNFKAVNDTYGHLAGDRVLVTIAELLTQGVRSVDLAGRYGGEEFLVIFPDTEASQAASISERIRAAIEAHAFNDGIRLTISAGVASAQGGSHTDLVSLADTRLYAAKHAGKNQVVSD